MYNSLEIREIFHLEFLRWLSRKLKPDFYALKGGCNMRFFFNSIRYSEDMDLDAFEIRVHSLKEIVMAILNNKSFQDNLKPFGVERIVPPDMLKAKQTETTQRFKVHLITASGEDLFTKVEFSRRGRGKGEIAAEPVLDVVLRHYKLAPLLIPHYDISSAITQKIDALISRVLIQARDVFDIYVLSSQYEPMKSRWAGIGENNLRKARESIFGISFEQFRDTVVSYLPSEDQAGYGTPSSWDEIKLKALKFIDELVSLY